MKCKETNAIRYHQLQSSLMYLTMYLVHGYEAPIPTKTQKTVKQLNDLNHVRSAWMKVPIPTKAQRTAKQFNVLNYVRSAWMQSNNTNQNPQNCEAVKYP